MSGEAAARATMASAPRPRVGRNALIATALLLTFALGAVAPARLAGDFVLRLANEGLLLGLLALSVAFLMSQAGLVALGVASVYGGAGYLFAIGMSAADLSPVAALFLALAAAAL
jgi:branched-chain amino acid transport system permease protein